MVPPAVAAGHPATCAAGIEILEDGGSAADAAVAASLASCVAETVMTGLLGGGFAIHLDAATGVARNLDFFVDVPTGEGLPMDELAVPFGEELVHYAIGAASCAVPGVAAGLGGAWGVQRRAAGGRPGGAAGGGGGDAGTAAVVAPGRAGGAARARGRADAAGARRVPRDARAGDDDARGRPHLRAGGAAAR